MRWIISILLIGFASTAFANELTSENTTRSFWETYTAALRGDKIAQFQTGVIYERGIGVEENQTQAAKWYEKSAIQGYMDAQYNIALMYATGRGVDQNDGFAMMWLSLAAKQGDKEARKLLLEFLDGKYDKVKTSASGKKPAINSMVYITPLRLKTKEGAQICTPEGECISTKTNTTVTSKIKSGAWYKVSGMGSVKGWEPYGKEGWIEENSVEVRR
ncbi:tetratricopeptide repeat protein [Sulfuricurvum sp.]|uniref:tetratricopeptide repeat protein n=1 Tax=Sulfuricurvum sp. TaxID=2025608 RepID=UPI003BB125E6